MKNRKLLLTFGTLALVLVLGVGYAVVSSVDLNITGTASVKGATLNVAFNGTTEVSDEAKVTATATDGSLAATISVKDLELNQSVTATYTIKNAESDVDASVLKSAITNDKEDFFNVTTSVDSDATTVAAGGTATVTVTVKLVKTPVTDADSIANIGVKLTATPVQK